MKKITFVLTSCGRNDLLEKTLDSFFKYNTHPIERYIITEDSADPKVFEECERLNREKYDGKLEFIFNYEKLGQAASIDKAYSIVDTEYIFHCEEDWEFYRSRFIEDSIKVLETQPKVIQAWIRPKSDKILNKIEDKVYTLPGEVKVRRVLPVSFIVKGANKDGTDIVVKDYIGFSWNPGVKRLKDWQQLPDGYSGFVREHLVDHYYRDNGFMVVSLSTNDEEGYVRHLGWGRRAGDPEFIKKDYKILGVGHPRTGTGYTSKLLQNMGLDVGHETLMKDGVVAWQFIIPKPILKENKLPWFNENIDHNNLRFETIIYNVRNPKTSIPSIINTEGASLGYRSIWTPIAENKNKIENVIVSIVWTDLRIHELYQDVIVYRIEDQHEYLFNTLKQKYDLKKDYELPPSNYNKKREYDSTLDWDSVRPRYRNMINVYCAKYGYEKIF